MTFTHVTIASLTAFALSGALPAAGAPAASPAHTTARQRPHAPYHLVLVAPRALPAGALAGEVSGTAVGISEAGVVAGNVSVAGDRYEVYPFTGGARGAGWLPRAVPGQERTAEVEAIAPNGRLAGSIAGPGPVVRWERGRVRALPQPSGSSSGTAIGAINSRGEMVGCSDAVKVDVFARWSVSGALARPLAYKSGTCRIAGLSEGGRATGTLGHPRMPNDGGYPRAVAITDRAAAPLPGFADVTASADAQSPDGRLVVGRVNDAAGLSLLTARGRAVPLRSTGGLHAQDVTNRGLIVGERDGRASAWFMGRMTDLTAATALPRGWSLTDAVAANERGEIAVNVRTADGRTLAGKLTRR